MKILVTGAKGQLGQEWCKYLKSVGIDPICCDSAGLDITNPKKVDSILSDNTPDVLINCAAYTAVDQAEENREQANLVNHEAVGGLSAACKKRGIKLVHFSTDYIFPGDAGDKERFPEGYPENADASPINFYGQTKWQGEQAIRKSGCDYLIIRVSWLCGRFGNNFVKTMLRLAGKNSELRIVADQWGSPTFTEDVVKNTHTLLERELSGTFHITSKGMTNWADFAHFIFECAGKNIDVQAIPTSQYPTDAVRPKFSKLNTQKVKHVDGIELIHWKEGIKSLIKELQNT